MKILFIVQGEGRGHLTQAISLERLLRDSGHDVVEMLVGKSESRRLPGFFVRSVHAPIRQFTSPNFLPTQANRRVNMPRSVVYNIFRFPDYVESMCYINRRIKESGADMVVNFYELLTGLTYFLFRPSVPQVCIGHQYLFLHRDFGLPKRNRFSLRLMNLFTRLTSLGAKRKLALSFRLMANDGDIHVIPPLLRADVFTQECTDGDYIHGYLLNSGFAESVRRWHKAYPDVPLHFFWDFQGEEPVTKIDDTLSFHQLDDVDFLRRMAGCKAYASTAGFESVCEAMYLGKPILMVPAHIEQECNAYDAVRNGAGVADEDFNLERLLKFAETYRPNPDFVRWTQSAGSVILDELESFFPQNQLRHMFMVEEFV